MPSGRLDHFTGMQAVISSDHSYIHDGKAYVLCGDTGSIAAAGVEHISFTTPGPSEGIIVHLRPAKFSSSANSASITIVEGAAMSSGSKATPQNCNRNKKNNPHSVLYTGATLGTAGLGGTIYKENVGTGGVPNRAGGTGGADEERVLKPGTTYSITFTNTGSTTATICSYMLFWYEE